MSYNTGRHNWKVGYEYRRTTVDGYFNAGYRAARLREPRDFVAAGSTEDGRHGRFVAADLPEQQLLYVQDNFQAGRHVTLNWASGGTTTA